MSYVLFSTTSKVFSEMIRLVTWSEYSHVEIMVGSSVLGADALKGVIELDLNERLELSKKVLLCEYEGTPEFENWAYAQLGKKYDWGALLGILARHDWEHPNKWFCSEMVAESAVLCGKPIVDPRDSLTNRIVPRDLLLSPALKVITKDKDEIQKIAFKDTRSFLDYKDFTIND